MLDSLLRKVLVVALAGAMASSATAQEKLVIGAVIPNTGGMAVLGNDLGNWYEIAVEEQNAKGGILGRQIELVRGDAVNAQEAITAVDRLVGSKGAEIVVGTIASFLSQAASEAALSSNVLYWETGSLAKDLTERGLPNYVRSGPNTVNFAQTAAKGVIDVVAGKLGKAPSDIRVWVEHEDSNYGTSIAEEQQRVLGEAGVTVERSGHAVKAVDLTDSVLRAKAFNPDVWIISGYVVDTHLLLRTAREQGFKPSVVMLVGLGDSKETVDAIGLDYLQGMLVVTYPRQEANPTFAPGADALSDLYVEKFNQQPAGNSGFGGYVGMQILFKALEAAGSTDFESVIAAAKTLDEPVGTYANGYGVMFDDMMQNTRANAVIYQWQGDKTVVVYPDEARKVGVELQDLARP